MLEEMVKQGRLGRKSGKGFYDVCQLLVSELKISTTSSGNLVTFVNDAMCRPRTEATCIVWMIEVSYRYIILTTTLLL
jgi:3-hydroxyacyl-CoA dehydrogenase